MREVVLDTETTGLEPLKGHKLVEIGCVELINKVKTGVIFHTYINPKRNMPREAFEIHGISEEFLRDKGTFENVAKDFLEFINGATLIIHNAKFDLKFLNYELEAVNFSNLYNCNVIDTLELARKKYPGSPASLDALCKRYKIDLSKREKHGALLDAELLAEVYINLIGGSQTNLDFNAKNELSQNIFKKPIIKNFRSPRKYSVTKNELDEHEKVVNKLKDPLFNLN